MTDDFRASFAQAAQDAGYADPSVPEAPGEPDTAPEPEPELEPVEPEPGLEPEPEAEPGEALLAGKYKSVEELERAYADMQEVLGRQGSELNALRDVQQEMGLLREQLTQPARPSFNSDEMSSYLLENPQQIPAAAQQGLDTGNWDLYRSAISAWNDVDPLGAYDFHARVVSAADVNALRAEMAPFLENVQRTSVQHDFESAFETKSREHPDFAQVINAITDETIQGFPPETLAALQTGDQASKERVLETLYRWVKAEQAGTLTEAAQSAVRQSVEESRQERQQAVVASAGTSTSREPVTGIDAYRQAFVESDAYKKAAGLI